MKTILTVIAMVTVAPLVASTTLLCWAPDRWGGSVNPLAIVVMAFFGVITVPLWPTYIPAIIVAPLAMKRIARLRAFARLPLPVLIGLSLLVGVPVGVCVMIPVLRHRLDNPSDLDLARMWTAAGATSGAVTLTVISLIHRLAGPRAEPNAAPNSRRPSQLPESPEVQKPDSLQTPSSGGCG